MASSRRQRNHIAALRSGDLAATDLEGKVELATDFFMGLLGSAQPRDFDLSLGALGLQPLDLSGLEAQFSEVDVMAAMKYMWLGRDQGFEVLNEALITLLPKKEGAVDLKDFRPVNLVHSFGRLLTKDAGVLADLASIGLRHRVSLYADDMVIFAKPDVREIAAVWGVLGCFGAASGLKVNFAKSSAAPIQCFEEVLQTTVTELPCWITSLPSTYLGLPLSLSKPRKSELQAVVDKLAAELPFWKPRLMTREGRVVYVQAVMTASVVYQLLALDLDPWFFKAVDKLRRGFLCAGKDDAHGGCCVVAWRLVCQPKSLGGLGLHNLRMMNNALRTRWLWM
ncbi:hypothetical protein ACQ4PT_035681 [Festuca glaucescens]